MIGFPPKKVLKQAYALCEAIMMAKATSFYQAFKGLPKERFLAVASIYAFNRYADDLVDNVMQTDLNDALKRLDVLEDNLKKIKTIDDYHHFDESIRSLPWWAAFVDTVLTHQISINACRYQLAGQRFDATFPGILTLDDLVDYAKKVAGSVGLMLLPLLVKDSKSLEDLRFIEAAEKLGVAMQITNILRDIGEDYRTRKRIYLPKELLNRFGVSEIDIKTWSESKDAPIVSQNMIDLWEYLSDVADQYYQAYVSYVDYFHPKARLPLIAAAAIYQAIANAVRSAKYNAFTQRCYTSKEERDKIIKVIMKNKIYHHLHKGT